MVPSCGCASVHPSKVAHLTRFATIYSELGQDTGVYPEVEVVVVV